jgi:hypothetical protein
VETIDFLVSLFERISMKDLVENNLIRFKNISKKKDTIYANFKVKGVKGGVNFTASITVDISAAEVHAGDVLEKIIEECARIGLKEFKRAEFQFEGLSTV